MSASPTKIDAVADGIYRIHTPVADVPGGFSFNQYLIVDDAPLLFHTGPRKLFPLVSELERVGLVTRRYALGPGDVVPCHVEADDRYVLTTLRADMAAATRVDLIAFGMRFEDVPFDRDAGSVLLVDAAEVLARLPSVTIELSLVAVDDAGERPLGQFFLDHHATPP
jgi:hypothetical protein